MYIDVDSMDIVQLLSLENHSPAVSCEKNNRTQVVSLLGHPPVTHLNQPETHPPRAQLPTRDTPTRDTPTRDTPTWAHLPTRDTPTREELISSVSLGKVDGSVALHLVWIGRHLLENLQGCEWRPRYKTRKLVRHFLRQARSTIGAW